MAVITPATSASILNWLIGNATTTTATRYIAGFFGDPQATGVEQTVNLTGTATRVAISSAFPITTTSTLTNNADIFLTSSCVTGCTVNYMAIMSAATGGVVMASAAVTSKTLSTGDSLRFASGNLSIQSV